ncbi:hypothetical protein [Rhizobium wuzhouense]|nr:hypothetical protein [Rhizobium wuzhouense]
MSEVFSPRSGRQLAMPAWAGARPMRATPHWLVARVLLVSFGTAISLFVLGDQRNVLVILVAALALPTIIVLRLPLERDFGSSAAAIAYLIVVELAHGGTTNVTSLGYTGMFALSYIAFAGTLESGFVNRERLIELLRQLVFAFAAVSVVQMLCSLAGLPILNGMLSKGAWSYNSLAVEPSHAARALSSTMLSYLILARRGAPPLSFSELWQRETWVVVAFSVSQALTGSSLAVALLPLTIVLALRLRWIVGCALLLIMTWPILQSVELESVHRLVGFLTALPTMDIMALVQADQSGAVRVMPLILFLQSASLDDPSVWFGGGYQIVTQYVQGRLVGVGEDAAMAGFIPGYIMIAGIIGTTLFLRAYLLRFTNLQTLPLILLWGPVLGNSAWNSQIFWYSLLLLRAVHHFAKASPTDSFAFVRGGPR